MPNHWTGSGASCDQPKCCPTSSPLERPFTEFYAGQAAASEVLLVGLRWPTECWVELALRWIEQGAPVNADVYAAW